MACRAGPPHDLDEDGSESHAVQIIGSLQSDYRGIHRDIWGLYRGYRGITRDICLRQMVHDPAAEMWPEKIVCLMKLS